MAPVQKILDLFGFTPQEQLLLKKVVKYSTIMCVAIVVIVWGVQKTRIKYSAINESTLSASGSSGNPYREGSESLLELDIEAHELSADYYMRTNQPNKAIIHILRILSRRGDDRALRLDLATAYLNSFQYREAYNLLLKLSEQKEIDQYSEAIESRLGLVLFYLGKEKESREHLHKCLERFKHSAETACYLGQVQASLDKSSPEAEQYLKQAITWNPNYSEAWYQLARYYMAIGEYEKSRNHLLQVLEIEPLHVTAHSRLGMAYYYLKHYDLAEKSYQTALALNPGDFNTLYNLGELYYAGYHDLKKAFKAYRKALEYNPEHVEANFKAGLICLSNNMNKEAVRYLSRAYRNAPTRTPVLLQLGVAYEKLGLLQEALEIYKTIVSYDELNLVALQKIRLLTQS